MLRIASTSCTVSSPWRSGKRERPSSVSDQCASGPAGALGRGRRRGDEPVRLERFEVLADRGLRQLQAACEHRGRHRLFELQHLEHPLAPWGDAEDVGHGANLPRFARCSLTNSDTAGQYRKQNLAKRCRGGHHERASGVRCRAPRARPVAHEGGLASCGRVRGRRRRLRHRGPLPAHGLPVASWDRRVRSGDVSLAPRALRPRVGCTLDPFADDV